MPSAEKLHQLYGLKKEIDKLPLPLTKLKDGEKGIITSIKVTKGHGRGRKRRGGGWGLERRLMDMGLTHNTTVQVVKSAPFNGPIEIIVRGSRLALGRGVAERVLVEVEK